MNKERIKELDSLVPAWPLVLYAKGWIRFPNSRGFMNDMCRICRMCGYIPTGNMPVMQILMLYRQICEYADKFGSAGRDGIWPVRDLVCFMERVYTHMRLYGCGHDEAIMQTVCSELSGMVILTDMRVRPVDYRAMKLRTLCWKPGDTYAMSQRKYDRTFRNNMLRS